MQLIETKVLKASETTLKRRYVKICSRCLIHVPQWYTHDYNHTVVFLIDGEEHENAIGCPVRSHI